MKPAELFEQTGYALKFGMFSKDEIDITRKAVAIQFAEDEKAGLTRSVRNTGARYAQGDLLSKKHLRHILLDGRMVQMAKDILQSEHIVYFGDSTYQIGTGSRGFHRDCVDRNFNNGPDWQSPYNIIRMGIYLQDHANYSGGLKIKIGSHNNASGKSIFIDSHAGDVAAWSLKTLHSGNAVRIKGMKGISIDNSSIENRIPGFLKLDQAEERMSLFMTFGVAGAHVDRYIHDYMLKRDDVIANMKVSTYDQDALQMAERAGVSVLQPLLQPV
ncbi:MAG: hypothetical protein ACKVOR_06160 [Flavobacteriales bacterium]